jgi:hypothetical protein
LRAHYGRRRGGWCAALHVSVDVAEVNPDEFGRVTRSPQGRRLTLARIDHVFDRASVFVVGQARSTVDLGTLVGGAPRLQSRWHSPTVKCVRWRSRYAADQSKRR